MNQSVQDTFLLNSALVHCLQFLNLHYITLPLRSLPLERFIYNYLVCRTLTGAKPRGSSLNFTLRAIGPFRRAHFGTSYWVKRGALRLFSLSELLCLFQFGVIFVSAYLKSRRHGPLRGAISTSINELLPLLKEI